MIQKRNIAIAILLSIITCGIYNIYWFIKLTNEVNHLTGNEHATSGGVAFLLTIVTCGIYGLIWAYKMGDKLDTFEKENGYRGIIYLLLDFFGLGIVTQALIQDTLNRYA